VVPVNVGESPTDDQAKEKYANLRARCSGAFREWAAEGMLAGLTDQTTIAQLAGIRYAHDRRGKIVIERKEDARKRGVKSPDRAEAVVLAFWHADGRVQVLHHR
jgi:phage terminase large subunit